MKKNHVFLIAAALLSFALVFSGCQTQSGSQNQNDNKVQDEKDQDEKAQDGGQIQDEGQTKKNDLSDAGEKKVFTVGFDQEFPPMGFVDDAGNHVGFDLDLAAEVANRLNMELKLQPIAWDSKNMELDSGNIDCVWNGFTISGREAEYEWTTPYMNNRQVIVVMDSSPYQTLDDLENRTIALQRDSSAQYALDANEQFKSVVTAEYTDTNLNALMNLEAGAVDAVLMDEIVARYNIERRQSGYRVLDEALSDEEFGVGFKLGNTELRDLVQNALEEMAQDGTLANISNNWFGKDITTIGK